MAIAIPVSADNALTVKNYGSSKNAIYLRMFLDQSALAILPIIAGGVVIARKRED